MQRNKIDLYHQIVKDLGQLLAFLQLYNKEHPSVKEKISEIFSKINESVLSKESLSFADAGEIFLVNGEKIEVKNSLIKRFIEVFRSLNLGSLDLEKGLTPDEFSVFMDLMNQADKIKTEGRIKEYLKEKSAAHITPYLATYKLVKENEAVVRENEVVKAEDLPAGVVERFLGDLDRGAVTKQLKGEDKVYQALAHDPKILSRLAFGVAAKENNPDELIRILMSIGDYLITGMSTAKDEENNRRVLDELRNCLFLAEEEAGGRQDWKERIQKAFLGIDAALELNGLVLLYQKHKKRIEKISAKLLKILKTLPETGPLYQKTRRSLEEIGTPRIDFSPLPAAPENPPEKQS